MPLPENTKPLENPKHEAFAHGIAQGLSCAQAYENAGYSKNGAQQSGARLLRDAVIAQRVNDIRRPVLERAAAIAEARTNSDAATRAGRIIGYIKRREALLSIIEARAADRLHSSVPGVQSGWLAATHEMVGKEKMHVGRFDAALHRELRELEKQIAIESGQWIEKHEHRDVNFSDIPTSVLKAEIEQARAETDPALWALIEQAAKGMTKQ